MKYVLILVCSLSYFFAWGQDSLVSKKDTVLVNIVLSEPDSIASKIYIEHEGLIKVFLGFHIVQYRYREDTKKVMSIDNDRYVVAIQETVKNSTDKKKPKFITKFVTVDKSIIYDARPLELNKESPRNDK